MPNNWKKQTFQQIINTGTAPAEKSFRLNSSMKINPILALLILLPGLIPLTISILGLTKVYVDLKISKDVSDKEIAVMRLHSVAKNEHFQKLRTLLDKYPQHLESKGFEGNTLLYTAAGDPNGLRKTALLLNRKINPNIKTDKGYLAIHAYPGSKQTVKLLTHHGLKLDIFAAAGHGLQNELNKIIDRNPDSANKTDPQGLTPLEHAAWNNKPSTAKILLKRNANPDIISACRLGFADLVETIIKKEPKAVNFTKPANIYNNPVNAAIAADNTQILKMLIDAGAEIKTNKMTYIHAARKNKNPQMLQLILNASTGPEDLAGQITDTKGNPIENALIDAWTWYQGCETQTCNMGFFLLQNIPSDGKTAQIKISAPGHCPQLITHQPRGISDLQISLPNDTFYYGQVLDSKSQPVSNALIKANQGPKRAEGVFISSIWTQTESDSNGFYKLYLQPDSYEIQAIAPSGQVALLRRHNVKKGSKKIDIKLHANATLTAKLIDAQNGKPLPGVTLMNIETNTLQATSDQNGILKIPGLTENRQIFTVNCNGYTRWWSPQAFSPECRLQQKTNPDSIQRNFDHLDFDIKALNGKTVKIYLERAAVIKGIVLNPKGKPVPKCIVTAAATGTGNSITGDSRFSCATNNEGAFMLMLPAGKEKKYNLIAHHGTIHTWNKWANGITEPLQTKPGQIINNIKIKLNNPHKITGKLLDESGQPVPNARIRATAADFRGNRYYNPSTLTDNKGNFTLNHLRPGSHYIQSEPFWINPTLAPEKSVKLINTQKQSPNQQIILTKSSN